MPLTSNQLTDFRADIGDETATYAFTNDELHRLYTRASDDYDLAIIYAFEQLLANVAKFYDYTAGFTRQEQEKIFDHVKEILARKIDRYNSVHQVKIVGLAVVPPHLKEVPRPSTSDLQNTTEIERFGDEQS